MVLNRLTKLQSKLSISRWKGSLYSEEIEECSYSIFTEWYLLQIKGY
jgi:hypothetical protein